MNGFTALGNLSLNTKPLEITAVDGDTELRFPSLSLQLVESPLAYVYQYCVPALVAGENYHCEQSRKW
jgi:hypothetical protein